MKFRFPPFLPPFLPLALVLAAELVALLAALAPEAVLLPPLFPEPPFVTVNLLQSS